MVTLLEEIKPKVMGKVLDTWKDSEQYMEDSEQYIHGELLMGPKMAPQRTGSVRASAVGHDTK